MKLKANISKIASDKIKWLIIESDETDTNGYFIYYHIDNNTAYDSWHKSIEDAYDSAYTQYGILRNEWELLSD